MLACSMAYQPVTVTLGSPVVIEFTYSRRRLKDRKGWPIHNRSKIVFQGWGASGMRTVYASIFGALIIAAAAIPPAILIFDLAGL
jgi:hypothetical protein